ncbi:hypothetical protein EVAR_17600_1 [Eumeta japonica]|uniref:Uncharacterized protein n=1 Tax=Eumeta variegata TaxID=151549 RepID=A0A4C1UBZ9_EUMVA|nr:hypothetical protein EVAR_17600_1 [Eumeta japonica]
MNVGSSIIFYEICGIVRYFGSSDDTRAANGWQKTEIQNPSTITTGIEYKTVRLMQRKGTKDGAPFLKEYDTVRPYHFCDRTSHNFFLSFNAPSVRRKKIRRALLGSNVGRRTPRAGDSVTTVRDATRLGAVSINIGSEAYRRCANAQTKINKKRAVAGKIPIALLAEMSTEVEVNPLRSLDSYRLRASGLLGRKLA